MFSLLFLLSFEHLRSSPSASNHRHLPQFSIMQTHHVESIDLQPSAVRSLHCIPFYFGRCEKDVECDYLHAGETGGHEDCKYLMHARHLRRNLISIGQGRSAVVCRPSPLPLLARKSMCKGYTMPVQASARDRCGTSQSAQLPYLTSPDV